MDGAAEARRQLLVPPGPEREARGRVLDDAPRGHHHGLPERVLRPSAAAGLLRGAAKSDGAGHDDADDTAGADLGPTCHLHSGKEQNEKTLDERAPADGCNSIKGTRYYVHCSARRN